MRSVLEISPASNFSVSSPADRWGELEGLARCLMGLSHSVQLISQCRESTAVFDWPSPPRLTRRWLAVVTADNAATLEWRARTLSRTLSGIGMRCQEYIDYESHRMKIVESDCVFDGYNSDQWCATLVLRRWPREVAPGWLGQALAGDDLPVDCAIHIEPQDAQQVARFLKHQQSWTATSSDAGDEIGRDDAERVRKNLIARVDKPCKVAIVLTVRAPDRDTLRTRVETLQHEVGLALADIRLAKFEQDRGLEATLPTGVCRIVGAYRTLDCTSVASTYLFQPPTILHERGAAIGTSNGMLVQLDPFDGSLSSFSGLLTGSVGSGKSYFLKLILRHLKGVELRIVEHSDPPEYDGVPNLLMFSVADLNDAQKAVKVREYITALWALARSDPKPRLLVLDELWSVLKRPELAELVEEVARRGRKYGLALWIATQQIEELIANEWGKAIFDNAKLKVYLQQEDRDLEGLCKAAHLPEPARRLLRGAVRGQALIQSGKMLVMVDVQATLDEHQFVTTDPREVWAAQGVAA